MSVYYSHMALKQKPDKPPLIARLIVWLMLMALGGTIGLIAAYHAIMWYVYNQ